MKKKAVEYKIKAERQEFTCEKIKSSEDAYKFAKKFYFDDIMIYESAFILLLNQANNVTGYAKISQGGISSTLIDVRIVAKFAIETLASSVILVHNHPSGNLNPSNDDMKISQRLKEALNILNIKLLDSVIISDNSFYSMQDNLML